MDNGNVFALMEQRINKGFELAESKWAPQLKTLDGLDRSFTAQVLENTAS